MAGERKRERKRWRWFFGKKAMNHVSKDLEHVHKDIEHLKREHVEDKELKSHLNDINGHLHDLIKNGEKIKSAMPLAFFSAGNVGEIQKYQCGPSLARRLAEMGLTPSTRVRIISSNPPGPVLIEVRGSRVALGRGMAMQIMAKEVS